MTYELAVDAAKQPTRVEGNLIEERELVAAVLEGDGVAFEIVMRRHNRLMFRTARAILENESDAEDVVQEAYIRAYTKLRQFSGRARLSTWLCRIVVNEALGRLRQRAPFARQDDILEHSMKTCLHAGNSAAPWIAEAASPEDEAARRQLRVLMEQAIDGLPRDQRAVFMLRAVEGFSTEETSECLSIPTDTVKTRLHRAKKRLRSCLNDCFEESLIDVFPFAGARCDRVVAGVLGRLNGPPLPG